MSAGLWLIYAMSGEGKMSNVAFRAISDALRNCCSGAKLFLFTRLSPGADWKRAASCDNNCNLSDKNTFFAWQRNHMANERTFLSWCRTGISLIGFGFLIERFDVVIREMRLVAIPGMSAQLSHVPSTRYMGMVALGLGVVIIVLAGWRFYYIRKHINSGDPSFSVVPDTFLLGSVLLTVASAFVFFAFYF
jgi:putative membrane protein